MTFYRRVVEQPEAEFYGGEATLGQIAEAGRQTALYVDNVNARDRAMEEAFDEAASRVRAATGVVLQNPAVRPPEIPNPLSPLMRLTEPDRGDLFGDWNRRIDELIESNPDKAEVLRSARLGEVERAAEAKARGVDARLSRLMGTREGLGKYVGAFAGGFAGLFGDPYQVATLPLGAGAGAARTFAGKVLATAWREALVNAGVEAAMQPTVQKWRAEAGLPSGFAEGAANVAMAAAFGGVLGGAGRAIVETPAAIRTLRERGAAIRPPETVAADLAAVREASPEALPAAVRGAVDQVEADAAVRAASVDRMRGLDVDPEFHELLVGEVLDAGGDPELLGRIAFDMMPQRVIEAIARHRDPELFGRLADLEKSHDINRKRFDELSAQLRDNDRFREVAGARIQADRLAGEIERAMEVAQRPSSPKEQASRTARVERLRRDLAGVLERVDESRVVELEDLEDAVRLRREALTELEARREAARAEATEKRAAARDIYWKSVATLPAEARGARLAPAASGEPSPDAQAASADSADDFREALNGGLDESFEPGGPEAVRQAEELARLADDDVEFMFTAGLDVDDEGAVSARMTTVREALAAADRDDGLSQLVQSCRLT